MFKSIDIFVVLDQSDGEDARLILDFLFVHGG